MRNLKKIEPIRMFNNFSNRFIPEVDKFINNYYMLKIKNAEYPFMKDMYSDLNEYCRRPGKRIRPLILLISYSGYKKGRKIPGGIVKLASVLEMMHSFLLIQDDIIDKSLLRRGKKSLHILSAEKYSNMTHNENIGIDIAIVLADVLFSNAIEIIGESKIDHKIKNDFLKIFSSTYEMTAWGQILDSLYSLSKNAAGTEHIPLQISKMKTAYYTIYYPMLMGYILSGISGRTEKKLIRDFALPLGLAFQIRDDVLGVFGSEDKTGKPVDSDIIEGKMTLLVQNTVDNLSKKDRDRFFRLFTKKKKKKHDIKHIKNMIENSGALNNIKDRHSGFLKDSEKNLASLNVDNAAKRILNGIIELFREINI